MNEPGPDDLPHSQDGRPVTAPVEIRLPADPRYLAVIRLAATGLISAADPDLESVENLQLAVNEIVSLLIDHAAAGSTVEVALEGAADRIGLSARCNIAAAAESVVHPMTARVLDSTTESWQVRDDGTAEMVVLIGGG